MVIRKREFEKGAGRITFQTAGERTEKSTRKVNRGWTAVGCGNKVKR
jgi:hypothetical protein